MLNGLAAAAAAASLAAFWDSAVECLTAAFQGACPQLDVPLPKYWGVGRPLRIFRKSQWLQHCVFRVNPRLLSCDFLCGSDLKALGLAPTAYHLLFSMSVPPSHVSTLS